VYTIGLPGAAVGLWWTVWELAQAPGILPESVRFYKGSQFYNQMDIVTLAADANLNELRWQLNNNKDLKMVDVYWTALGGIPSVFINISLDDRDTWSNGIFQNSRYSQFVIHDDMKLEQMTCHYKLVKYRKSKIKGVNDVVNKIQKWANSNSQ
jgi:hypothetical protein